MLLVHVVVVKVLPYNNNMGGKDENKIITKLPRKSTNTALFLTLSPTLLVWIKRRCHYTNFQKKNEPKWMLEKSCMHLRF